MSPEVIERVADFAAGGFDETGDVDVADAGPDQEGQIDRRTRDLIADQIEDQRLGCAFAADRDRDMGAAGAFQQCGDCGRIHAVGGFAVDRNDHVARTDACFVGGRSLEGIETTILVLPLLFPTGCGWIVMPTP